MLYDWQWKSVRASTGALGVFLCMLSAHAQQTFSAPGMRNAKGSQQQPTSIDTKTPPPEDNPLVHEPSPPPENAKLMTKVGWCEVQVFGHTFSDSGMLSTSLPLVHMNLPKRLEQLNLKLHFQPQKSGLQLMDDGDALVKKVVEYREQTQPKSGSSSKAREATPAK